MRPVPALLAAILAAAPRLVAAEPLNHAGTDFYFGDLHAHTGLSLDGYSSDFGAPCPGGYECGSVATVLQDARDVRDLDFVSLTEHGNGFRSVEDPLDWEVQLENVLAADDPDGGFVTVPGVELWLWKVDGSIRDHRNLYFFGDSSDLDGLSLQELVPDESGAPYTTDACSEIFDWLGQIQQTRGTLLLIPHHPAAQPPGATDWTCVDMAFNPVVENFSEHGNSQWPSYEGSYDPIDPDAEWPGSTVDYALSPDHLGLRLGIIGGTDSHDTRPGSTCDLDPRFADHAENYGGGLMVVAIDEGERFDRAAILQAMRSRRTLSTSGPRIPVEFLATSGGITLAAMGEEVDATPAELVTFRVTVPLADAVHVTGATLIRPEHSRTPMTDVDVGHWEETLSPDESLVAYALVEMDGAAYWQDLGIECDDGGEDGTELIWTSPIWIDVAGDDDSAGIDEGGCECSSGNGSVGITGWTLLVLAGRLRRRARRLP